MEPQVFDVVKFEKGKAVARFNRFRRIVKLWQILEVLVVFGLISWSSARVPAALKATAVCVVQFSSYLFNHHVVFLIGNVIIVALVVLCRRSDGGNLSSDGDFYDEYVKHSEAASAVAVAHQPPPPTAVSDHATPSADEIGDEEKQIVVCFEEKPEVPQCDDVSAAIENATRQIRRFQRTQSEKLKHAISVRPQAELRRSETENHRKLATADDELHASEIETLSNEDFRRTVDAFIDKHWSKKKSKEIQKYEFVNENVKSVRLQA